MNLVLDSFVAVPLSHELYARLVQRYPTRVATLLEDVITDFLDRTDDDFAEKRSRHEGYSWGATFLPNGTQVRTKYLGKFHVAEIVDRRIVWNSKQYSSPSRLARAMRGDTSNNAWVVLQIKRPTDADWILADRLRR